MVKNIKKNVVLASAILLVGSNICFAEKHDQIPPQKNDYSQLELPEFDGASAHSDVWKVLLGTVGGAAAGAVTGGVVGNGIARWSKTDGCNGFKRLMNKHSDKVPTGGIVVGLGLGAFIGGLITYYRCPFNKKYYEKYNHALTEFKKMMVYDLVQLPVDQMVPFIATNGGGVARPFAAAVRQLRELDRFLSTVKGRIAKVLDAASAKESSDEVMAALKEKAEAFLVVLDCAHNDLLTRLFVLSNEEQLEDHQVWIVEANGNLEKILRAPLLVNASESLDALMRYASSTYENAWPLVSAVEVLRIEVGKVKNIQDAVAVRLEQCKKFAAGDHRFTKLVAAYEELAQKMGVSSKVGNILACINGVCSTKEYKDQQQIRQNQQQYDEQKQMAAAIQRKLTEIQDQMNSRIGSLERRFSDVERKVNTLTNYRH